MVNLMGYSTILFTFNFVTLVQCAVFGVQSFMPPQLKQLPPSGKWNVPQMSKHPDPHNVSDLSTLLFVHRTRLLVIH